MNRSTHAVTLEEPVNLIPSDISTTSLYINRGSPQFMRVTLALLSADEGAVVSALLFALPGLRPTLAALPLTPV